MANDQKPLSGKRIGVFGKGGSGKSTITVLLSRVLSKHGYKVCVLDADSTNVGLSQVLGYDHPPAPLLEYFGGAVFSGGSVTCPVDDPLPLANADFEIENLPQGYYQEHEDGITMMTAGKIGSFGPGAGCDGPIAKIARDLRIHSQKEQPVLLIDFKAGFEDSARGAVTSLDWAFVVIDPTTAAIEMAVNMRDMIEQIKADVLPATSHLETDEMVFWANKFFIEASIQNVFYILNQIHDSKMEEFISEKLAGHQIQPLGVIYRDDSISNSWLKGIPIESIQATEVIEDVVSQLEKIDQEEVAA
jgi:CO dehydrogenase maturation factor